MKKETKKTMTAKKIITLGVLFIAVAIGIWHSDGYARYGGHHGGHRGGHHGGHRGGHRGFGRHRGRHHGGYRFGFGYGHRPYYHRRYYHRPYYYGYRRRRYYTDSRYDKEDNRGKMYWKIRNDTGDSIRVSSDSDSIKLRPGKTKRLYRRESFKITIKNRKTGKITEKETSDHNVTIEKSAKKNRKKDAKS